MGGHYAINTPRRTTPTFIVIVKESQIVGQS